MRRWPEIPTSRYFDLASAYAPSGIVLNSPESICGEILPYHNAYKHLRRVPLLVPQSSLCEMIIQGLKDSNPEHLVQEPLIVRWLWMTTGGAALYALTVGLITAMSGRCCLPATEAHSVVQRDEKNEDQGGGCVAFPVLGKCHGCCKMGIDIDNAERGIGTSASSNDSSPAVKSIIASFDAWLFADSKVLWAVLVSKIFEEVSRQR